MDASPASKTRVFWAYAGAVAFTVFALVAGQRLDRADFRAPFVYEYDALLILPLVKETVEGGTHWQTPRLGAPGVQELHDFPVVDHLHFAVIWVLGRFVSDAVVVFNLFHLLTYPLTTLAAMFVLRRFGLSLPAAACGGILYAFQPYHYLRGEVHYFLAAYYVVPFTLMVAIWVCQGRLPFFRRDEAGDRYRFSLRNRDALEAAVIAAATASAGAYYAFFACAFFAMAALYGWVATRTWKAAASGGLLIVGVVGVGVLNHAPAIAYQIENGPNSRVTARLAEEAEIYGMKIAHLVMPVTGHNSRVLARIRSEYNSPAIRPLQNENEWNAFGLVATVGFVGLLASLVLPVKRDGLIAPLAALTAFGTLYGTLGGFSAVFNLLVTAQVRCPNRISIYLAFLALFAVVYRLDVFFRTRTGRARAVALPAFAGLTVLGIWDQTNDQWFPDTRNSSDFETVLDQRAKHADRFRADAAFFRQVEEMLPEGMVFTVPYVAYPETMPYEEPGSPGKTESYENVRGYLHTRNLRWSFGAMKGREADEWIKSVSAEPAPRLLERIALAGFDGLVVDRRGLNPTRYRRFEDDLNQVLGQGSPRLASADGTLIFFDLRPYRQDLRQNYGPTRFEAMARGETDRLAVEWLKGFVSYEPPGSEWRHHWCGPLGVMAFVNRSGQPATVLAKMTFRTGFREPAILRIDGGELWSDVLTIDNEPGGPRYERKLTIPPGRHLVRFRCRLPEVVFPSDSRNLVFSIGDFKLTPAPPE